MNERQTLLASIAETIQDYRSGSLPRPISDHVERWIQQFDGEVQMPILHEVDYVLKKTYFSKERVLGSILDAIRTPGLAGENPKAFWQSANFLDIQGGGDSQTDMLVLMSEVLRKELGIGIEDCGRGDDVFIYFDDGIFTGNRVRSDLMRWVREQAPDKAIVHVICIALHNYGEYWANKGIQDAINTSGKSIEVYWWREITLEDRKNYSGSSDVLRPTEIPDDQTVIDYVAGMQYQPTLRAPGNSGAAGFFSSDEAKILLEQEFLKTGVRIRQMCPNLHVIQRPLGHMTLETLGFGSLIVTYRNCPNNAPLALWVNTPWYPLFPRTTNTQTAVRRMIADLPEDWPL